MENLSLKSKTKYKNPEAIRNYFGTIPDNF
jgi:hypothetical protein